MTMTMSTFQTEKQKYLQYHRYEKWSIMSRHRQRTIEKFHLNMCQQGCTSKYQFQNPSTESLDQSTNSVLSVQIIQAGETSLAAKVQKLEYHHLTHEVLRKSCAYFCTLVVFQLIIWKTTQQRWTSTLMLRDEHISIFENGIDACFIENQIYLPGSI